MRLAVAGWLITALAVFAGYQLGARRRQARLERAPAERRRPAPPDPAIDRSTAPVELPTDSRRSDSVPRGLQ